MKDGVGGWMGERRREEEGKKRVGERVFVVSEPAGWSDSGFWLAQPEWIPSLLMSAGKRGRWSRVGQSQARITDLDRTCQSNCLWSQPPEGNAGLPDRIRVIVGHSWDHSCWFNQSGSGGWTHSPPSIKKLILAGVGTEKITASRWILAADWPIRVLAWWFQCSLRPLRRLSYKYCPSSFFPHRLLLSSFSRIHPSFWHPKSSFLNSSPHSPSLNLKTNL